MEHWHCSPVDCTMYIDNTSIIFLTLFHTYSSTRLHIFGPSNSTVSLATPLQPINPKPSSKLISIAFMMISILVNNGFYRRVRKKTKKTKKKHNTESMDYTMCTILMNWANSVFVNLSNVVFSPSTTKHF